MPPPIRIARRLKRDVRSSAGAAPAAAASATSMPSIVACTSSTSVVVAPTISDRPRSRYAEPGDQRNVTVSPGRSSGVSSSLSTVTSSSVPPGASAIIRSDEPWKMTSLTVAGRLRPSAASPSAPIVIRSGRSITVIGSPSRASPADGSASRRAGVEHGDRCAARPPPSRRPGRRFADPMKPATKMLAGAS